MRRSIGDISGNFLDKKVFMSFDMSKSYSAVHSLLEEEGAPSLLIRHFERSYRALADGDSNIIPSGSISPVEPLPTMDALASYAESGRKAVDEVVILKLNGGLGTSMGLERAKSLLQVKDGLTFLDIIVRQCLHWRREAAARTPLLFMNSFSTRDDTLKLLDAYPELKAGSTGLPLDFLQHRVPKILADNGWPAIHPERSELTWCPPGHGDLYICLQTTGLLDQLLAHGFRYLFVSNADNLGAVLDPRKIGRAHV